ncbi:MFS transporter [Lentzea albidocapillata]|uniref:Transmembrane secretion effector n=1 Tax=Lentzea albidocapillata TaxID=40571 RepID=A0A1W2CVK2_9PSEU|nr:MFS transporter [Lentzea albidocapillata]SMC88986.1 Transmembrane secretion effector [Lentzea albidocapillata]
MSDEEISEPAPPRLLSDRRFRFLWTAETIGQLGTAISSVVIPLVAIDVLHATAWEVGLIEALVWLPWLLIGLPAGAWVDRGRSRRIILAGNISSLLLTASIPLAAWAGVLSTSQILVIAFLLGVSAVFTLVAFQTLLPSVVDHRLLPEANAKFYISESIAHISGPGIAGLLAHVLGTVYTLLSHAASLAISVLCLLQVKVDDRPPPRAPKQSSLVQEVKEGVRFTASDSYLRPIALYSAAANFWFAALQAVIMFFLVRTVGVSASTVGVLLTAGGLGGITGALLATKIASRFGNARALVLTELFTAPFGLLIPFTTKGSGLVLFIAGMIITGLGVSVSNVITSSFRQAYCPPHLLGRVITSTRFLTYGVLPVGAITGGTLATALDTRTAVFVVCLGQALIVSLLLASPIRKHRSLPERPS